MFELHGYYLCCLNILESMSDSGPFRNDQDLVGIRETIEHVDIAHNVNRCQIIIIYCRLTYIVFRIAL